MSIDPCGSEDRIDLAVYTGSGLGSLTKLASYQQPTPFPTCENLDPVRAGLTFRAHAGTVYRIQVDGDARVGESLPAQSGEAPFDFRLSNPTPPANDDFADAQPIEAMRRLSEEIFPEVDNFAATREPGEPNHRGASGGASVWFKWTASRTGGASLEDCGGYGEKAVVAVYTGASVGALTPVPELKSTSLCGYAFFATAGTTYRIAVDGRYDAATDAAEIFQSNLSLIYLPLNDDFAYAENLGEITGNGGGDTVLPPTLGATKEPGEPDHAGNAGGASVWYTMKASANAGSLELSACENSFPTLLAIYTGERIDALTPLASASVPPETPCLHDEHGPGQLRLNVVPGTTYHLAVDGVDGAQGRLDIEQWDSKEPLRSLDGSISPAAPPSSTSMPSKPKSQAPSGKIVDRRIDQRTRSAAFELRAAQPGTHFLCKLDRRRFVACGRKVTYRRLTPGHHVFRAIAVDADGETGTPMRAAFVIDRIKQEANRVH